MTVASRFELIAKFSSFNDEQRIAAGWLYVCETADGTQVTDHSGQYILADDLERASFDYVLMSRASSQMHTEVTDEQGVPIAECCASVVTTREVQEAWGLAPGAMPVGWWIAYYVYDESTWEGVKNGTLPMLSLAGSGILIPDDAPEGVSEP